MMDQATKSKGPADAAPVVSQVERQIALRFVLVIGVLSFFADLPTKARP
jgi:hypothetical protein